MSLVQDPTVRQTISLCLDQLCVSMPELGSHHVTLEWIDAFTQVLVSETAEDAMARARSALEPELSIAYLGALLLGLMSIQMEKSPPPTPNVDDTPPGAIPDPNLVLSKLLVNLANDTLAIAHLVESGLESQARAILRVLLETTWLGLVIVGGGEIMSLYVQLGDDESSREQWRKHFNPSRLRNRVRAAEALMGFPEDTIKVLAAIRTELYRMYSATTHNSFPALILGTLSFSVDQPNLLHSNLFGRADKASYPTLTHMNDGLFYFAAMFWRILVATRSFGPPYAREWQDVLALRELFLCAVRDRKQHESG